MNATIVCKWKGEVDAEMWKRRWEENFQPKNRHTCTWLAQCKHREYGKCVFFPHIISLWQHMCIVHITYMYPLLSQANKNLRAHLTHTRTSCSKRDRERERLMLSFAFIFSTEFLLSFFLFHIFLFVWNYILTFVFGMFWLLVYCTMYAHVFIARYVARPGFFFNFILTNLLHFIHFFIFSIFFLLLFIGIIFLWNLCTRIK